MKRRYSHLTLADRRQIERWRLMKMSGDEIARRLGRHRSTVSRKRRRNRHHDAEIPELTGCWACWPRSWRSVGGFAIAS